MKGWRRGPWAGRRLGGWLEIFCSREGYLEWLHMILLGLWWGYEGNPRFVPGNKGVVGGGFWSVESRYDREQGRGSREILLECRGDAGWEWLVQSFGSQKEKDHGGRGPLAVYFDL